MAFTADEAMAALTSRAGKSVVKVMPTANEIVAKVAPTADEAVTKVASTADERPGRVHDRRGPSQDCAHGEAVRVQRRVHGGRGRG